MQPDRSNPPPLYAWQQRIDDRLNFRELGHRGGYCSPPHASSDGRRIYNFCDSPEYIDKVAVQCYKLQIASGDSVNPPSALLQEGSRVCHVPPRLAIQESSWNQI